MKFKNENLKISSSLIYEIINIKSKQNLKEYQTIFKWKYDFIDDDLENNHLAFIAEDD